MSGKIRQRGSANTEKALNPLNTNERILKDCHQLYTDPDNGLVQIASNLNFSLLAPRKKISIMLIGNHSAGKSSFINWYIEEHVQKTGVAIETQGFSLITSGKKRESLTGNATLHLYPHFKPLADFPGLISYLNTEICTSKQKKFPLVTFIDTPGLVDGGMNYPFDVNEGLLWLGDLVDLIFVFFDPIGQALCKRTLNVVEALSNAGHGGRMRFYLSKADEAGHESDRQRVMMQIVQELCKRPSLNGTCFDMPTIFIPNPNKPVRCVNQIEEVCKDIEKTIEQTIQNTLNHLETDCDEIGQKVDEAIATDNASRSHNLRARGKGFFMLMAAAMIPLALILHLIMSTVSDKFLKQWLGKDVVEYLKLYVTPIRGVWNVVPEDYYVYAVICLVIISLVLIKAAKYMSRTLPTMTRKRKKQLLEQQEFVTTIVKKKKRDLYKEYLEQTVSEHDL